MSFRKKGQCVLLALFGFGAFSCTVKEDRSDCPCLLALDLRDVPAVLPTGFFPVGWSVAQGAFSDSGTLSAEDCAGIFHVVVPRGGVQVYAVAGDEGLFHEGIDIPPGHGCPPVWLWSAYVDARGETAAATVRLRKEHCLLTIRVRGMPAPRDYRMVVEGVVGGCDGAGRPKEGPFRCEPQTIDTEQDAFVACLPRQRDASLLLRIEDRHAAGTEPLRTFALGHAMAAAGYDWTAPDLEDLSLELDFAASTLTFRSDRWTRTLPFEVVI